MFSYSDMAATTVGLSTIAAQTSSSTPTIGFNDSSSLDETDNTSSTSSSAYNLDIGNSETLSGTYNSKGELGAAVVSKTLDTMNRGKANGLSNSFNLSKDVLGAYLV